MPTTCGRPVLKDSINLRMLHVTACEALNGRDPGQENADGILPVSLRLPKWRQMPSLQAPQRDRLALPFSPIFPAERESLAVGCGGRRVAASARSSDKAASVGAFRLQGMDTAIIVRLTRNKLPNVSPTTRVVSLSSMFHSRKGIAVVEY